MRSEGLEPPTYKFVACCSIQLSYDRMRRLRGDRCEFRSPHCIPAACGGIETKRNRRERDSNPRYAVMRMTI